MTINIQSAPLIVAGPEVELTLADSGSAHVSFTVFIPGVTPTPIQWDETFVGEQTFKLPMAPGNYRCIVQIAAFDTGNALGPVYRSEVQLNGTTFATAKGKVPKKVGGDFGDTIEKFTVT
jgi:hypothetical protein